jgi:hypothetical protein
LPTSWKAERIPGGYVVKDATSQSLAYVYAGETKADADTPLPNVGQIWGCLVDVPQRQKVLRRCGQQDVLYRPWGLL